MNEERTRLQETEHIHGHWWYRYSIVVNHWWYRYSIVVNHWWYRYSIVVNHWWYRYSIVVNHWWYRYSIVVNHWWYRYSIVVNHWWYRYSIVVNHKTFEVMTLSSTLGAVAFLLAANFYQRNHDRNHKPWHIISTERYILHTTFMHYLLKEYNHT